MSDLRTADGVPLIAGMIVWFTGRGRFDPPIRGEVRSFDEPDGSGIIWPHVLPDGESPTRWKPDYCHSTRLAALEAQAAQLRSELKRVMVEIRRETPPPEVCPVCKSSGLEEDSLEGAGYGGVAFVTCSECEGRKT